MLFIIFTKIKDYLCVIRILKNNIKYAFAQFYLILKIPSLKLSDFVS